MKEIIYLRDQRWNEEYQIKRVLRSLKDLMSLRDLVDTDSFDPLIYFVLSMFPIEDTSMKDGDVTEEYRTFLDDFMDYSIQELFDKLTLKRSGEQ